MHQTFEYKITIGLDDIIDDEKLDNEKIYLKIIINDKIIENCYHINGCIWWMVNFKCGKLHGLAKYYDDGCIWCMDNYKNGQLYGLTKFYNISKNFILT